MLKMDDVRALCEQEVAKLSGQGPLVREPAEQIVEVRVIGVEQVLIGVLVDERERSVGVMAVLWRERRPGSSQKYRVEFIGLAESLVQAERVDLYSPNQKGRMVVAHEEKAVLSHLALPSFAATV